MVGFYSALPFALMIPGQIFFAWLGDRTRKRAAVCFATQILTGVFIYLATRVPGADLSGARLQDADFSSADMAGASFTGTDLRSAKFVEANLKGADFSGAQVRATDFFRADLSGARWIDGVKICAAGSIGSCQ